jgi:hypothetical protein
MISGKRSTDDWRVLVNRPSLVIIDEGPEQPKLCRAYPQPDNEDSRRAARDRFPTYPPMSERPEPNDWR